jgi:hypothetical protein
MCVWNRVVVVIGFDGEAAAREMRNVREKRCSHGVPVIRCNPDCFTLFGKNSPSFGRRARGEGKWEFSGSFF